ncbi:peptidase M1 [Mucilaginibacter sp. MD40]|nr:peptidase M1 [Mucilaginibacter sp. MD40]
MLKPLSLLLSLLFTSVVLAQQPGAPVDVLKYRFAITLTDANNVIKGKAAISTRVLKPVKQVVFDLVGKNTSGKGMQVTTVTENGRPLKFNQDSSKLFINTAALQGSTHVYNITYQGIPADGLIISTSKYGKRTFFGDNWPTRAHNWLPCVDDPADKASVEFAVTAPAKYTVVANGLKVLDKALPGGRRFTLWKETVKLPTKVMVIGVAEFAVAQAGTPENIPVSSYVFPEDKDVGLKAYAVAAEILPWYTKRIGPFPYRKLANVQSKTIFGGMENAGAIFYFEESVRDKGIEALMAHEIAHQWFGDAVSEKNWANLWLSEGLATYMTNLYLEGKYGVDSLNKRLIADRKVIFDFEKSYNAPVVDTAFKGPMMQLLNANAYQKGGWFLHMLRRRIGNKAFWTGIAAYYKQYSGGNANTNDLCYLMEKASGMKLSAFFNQWLRQAGHPILNVKWEYLPQNRQVVIHVNQMQVKPYQLNLEIMVDGKLYRADIKDVATNFTFPALHDKPVVKIDPNINLLATYNLEGGDTGK